jgi:anti-anti-sigma regulatory factor
MRFFFWLRSHLFHVDEVAPCTWPLPPLRKDARRPGFVAAGAPAAKQPKSAGQLKVEMLETGVRIVVRLRGEAGVAEVSTLEASLLRLLARRPRRVTFDLSELQSISSLAIGALESYRRAAVRASARVGLVGNLHPGVREALLKAEWLGHFEDVGAAPTKTGPGLVAESTGRLYPTVYEVQRRYGVTWDQLVESEPQLATLLWRARMAASKCSTLGDALRVFGPVRDELAGLCWEVSPPSGSGQHRGLRGCLLEALRRCDWVAPLPRRRIGHGKPAGWDSWTLCTD